MSAIPAPAAPLGRFVLPRWLGCLGRPGAYAGGALVLTLLGSATTLMAPRLLDPTSFGSFALMTTLFTYAGRADLGLSQLADKLIPAHQPDEKGLDDLAAGLMRALWVTGLGGLLLCLPLVLLLPLPPGLALLALAGGLAAMIANGPVTIFRAAGRVAEFTALALVLQLGMTAPRLLGLLTGGVAGCFVALLVYYACLALTVARPLGRSGPAVTAILRLALPLFAFQAVWTLYLGANRLIMAGLATPHDLGLFSFGASLAMVGLGLLSTLTQLRYPALLAAHARRDPDAGRRIRREMDGLALLLSLVALMAILFAGRLVPLLFPAYGGAVPATIALAIGCIPLGTLVWIMPLVIVTTRRPVRDALVFTAWSLATLTGGIVAGMSFAGIEGAAHGQTLAALALFAATLLLLVRADVLDRRAATRAGLLQLVAVGLLTALALRPGVTVAADMPAKGPLIFEDNFDRLDLQQGGTGRWMPGYPDGSRTNAGNREQQYYLDPRPGRDRATLQAVAPMRIENGALAITASRLPDGLTPAARGMHYLSGMLNSHGRFAFLYGTAEIRAHVPAGQGVWPAFWMLPQKLGWPPEIDVFEVLGHDPATLQVTAHSGIDLAAGEASRKSGAAVRPLAGAPLSDDYHVYGVHWGPERLVWSLDGAPVFETETPADLHQPMVLLVNLALGGSWAGPVDDAALPATLRIDWIRVHALAKGES